MLATIFCSFIIVLYRSAIFRSISNGKANKNSSFGSSGDSRKIMSRLIKQFLSVRSCTAKSNLILCLIHPSGSQMEQKNRNLSIISPQTLSRHDSCAAWKKNRRAIGSLTENWANLISHCFYHKLIRFAFVVASACSRKLAARSSYFYLRNSFKFGRERHAIVWHDSGIYLRLLT